MPPYAPLQPSPHTCPPTTVLLLHYLFCLSLLYLQYTCMPSGIQFSTFCSYIYLSFFSVSAHPGQSFYSLKCQSQLQQTKFFFFFFFFFFNRKQVLTFHETIHMKFQDLFSLKNKKNNKKNLNVVCCKFCLELQGLRHNIARPVNGSRLGFASCYM